MSQFDFTSLCIRDFTADDLPDPYHSHLPPIYQSSTFIYESAEKAMDVFEGKEQAYIYSRWHNPTVDAVERKIAALEGFELDMEIKALMFSSGMAAISSMFGALLKSGDKLLTSGNIYGTTVELLTARLSPQGIESLFIDLTNLDQVENTLKAHPAIKLLYVETPTNPTITIYDLEELAKLAHSYDVQLAVDNTFSSPYIQQPFRWGADHVVHSATKYLNGHGTALGGIWLSHHTEFLKTKGWQMRKLYGGNSNALEGWLLNNGLKTLPLRMEKHSANAMDLALWLQEQPQVSRVFYAGLTDHPSHEIAKKQMRLYGGMLAFELKGGLEAGKRFMNKIEFCSLTSTLGTPDTLVTHPASMTHIKVPKAQRVSAGITDGLIRMSVGLEHVEDIRKDLIQAITS